MKGWLRGLALYALHRAQDEFDQRCRVLASEPPATTVAALRLVLLAVAELRVTWWSLVWVRLGGPA